MNNSNFEQSLQKAKNGNELERQKIIDLNKPYIINAVAHICKRFISWSDEESSIGLLAFNRAIDTYETSKGRSFLSYAYFLINRDLINYFRKNQHSGRNLSLDYVLEEESMLTDEEINKSIEIYNKNIESGELVEEILELDVILNGYGIKFEELDDSSPKHRDTREQLLKMVGEFIHYTGLVDEFLKKKRLPVTAFARQAGYPVKTIEKHRKYMITMIIIRLHPEWVHLSSYIKI